MLQRFSCISFLFKHPWSEKMKIKKSSYVTIKYMISDLHNLGLLFSFFLLKFPNYVTWKFYFH